MKTKGWLAAAVSLLAVVSVVRAQEAYDDASGPRLRIMKEMEESLSRERVLQAIQETGDGETLFGLCLFLQSGEPDRVTVAAKALEADRTLAPIVALIGEGYRWQGISANAAGNFIEADPSNALGYYLEASTLLAARDVLGAVIALRKGAECSGLETYDDRMVRCVRAAMDALKLRGAVRFYAAFSACRWGPQVWPGILSLPERTARSVARLPLAERAAVGDYLLAMAGQMSATARQHHWAKDVVHQAMLKAYLIKAEAAAAGKGSEEKAYRFTMEILESSYGDTDRDEEAGIFRAASEHAFWQRPMFGEIIALAPELSAESRAAILAAMRAREDAGQRFRDSAEYELDYILDTYYASGMPLVVPAEERRDLADAARRLVEAGRTVQETVRREVPRFENKGKLKQVGLGLLMYSNDHNGEFPPALQTLNDEGYVKDASLLKSTATGETWVYCGAANGIRDDSHPNSVLAYDPPTGSGGQYMVLFCDGHVENVPKESFEEMLKKQAKK